MSVHPAEGAEVRECQDCGAWVSAARCPRCEGADLRVATGRRPQLRVLLECAVERDGRLTLVSGHCARLPWLLSQPDLERRVQEQLTSHSGGEIAGGPLHTAMHDAVAEGLRALLTEPDDGLDRRRSPPRIALTLRLRLMVAGLRVSEAPGVQIIPVNLALEAAARDLDPSELRWEAADLPDPVRQPVLMLNLSSRRRVITESLQLRDRAGAIVASTELNVELVPGAPSALALPFRQASALWALVTERLEDVSPWTLSLRLRGRGAPIERPLARDLLTSLPGGLAQADLYLHMGSGSIRTLLLPSGDPARGNLGDEPTWQWVATEEIADALGLVLPPRESWQPEVFAACVAPVVEGFAALAWRSRGVWLRKVVLATPGDDAWVQAARQNPRLTAAARRWLVSNELTLWPEARALARHFQPALIALATLHVQHRRAWEAQHDAVFKRRAAWSESVRRRENQLLRQFTPDPGPEPAPPPPLRDLGLLPAEVGLLLEADPHVAALAIVDGGLNGVDVSVLRGTGLRTLRLAWGAEPEVALRDAAEFIKVNGEPRGQVVVATGGAFADRAALSRLNLALRGAGAAVGGALSNSDLVAAARAALDQGHQLPALHRLLEVPSASNIAIAGRYDVLDGLRP